MQLLGVAFLMYFVITKKSVIKLMVGRLPSHMLDLPPEKEKLMRKMMKDMAILLFLHTFLIVYSAYYMSTASWTFISGVLPYLLIFLLMFFEAFLIKRKLKKEMTDSMNNITENSFSNNQNIHKGTIRNRK
jgi:Ca2+/Na+ antiporter